MSSVLAEFLQQFFTLIFTAAVVVLVGGRLAWVLLLFVPVILYSSRKIGRQVRTTTRGGQDKLAEIQNILHETITGNRIVKAFGMENWEVGALPRRRAQAVPGEPEAGGGVRDQFSADGYSGRDCDCSAVCCWDATRSTGTG